MHVLFVCTGNLCRSPMAEGIARHRYPALADYTSAGTAALSGSPPTGLAVAAAAEIEVDISGLQSSGLSDAPNPPPHRIYVMTARHRGLVAARFPRLSGRIELLDPAGEVADPYGLDLDSYRAARDQIVAAIDLRAEDWGSGVA